MLFSRDFFDLNLRFARKVAALSGLSFEDAVLHYTHCYVRFTQARDFNADHPVWQAFLAGLREAADPVAWTHVYYLKLQAHAPSRLQGPQFGCSSYNRWHDGRARLHFHNAEPPGVHPLGPDRRAQRHAELAALTAHIREHAPDAGGIRGGSWLYHLEAYRRLFPRPYVDSAEPGSDDYPYMALWGQFLDRDGEVRHRPAAQFVEQLERAATLPEALASFPFGVLYVEAEVQVFYEYYLDAHERTPSRSD